MNLEINLRSTAEVVTVDGVPCRVWQGHTADGVEVTALVHRIMVRDDVETLAFDAALVEERTPREWAHIIAAVDRARRTQS